MTQQTVFTLIDSCNCMADFHIIRTTRAADYAQAIEQLFTLGVADYEQTDKCLADVELSLQLKRIELIENINKN